MADASPEWIQVVAAFSVGGVVGTFLAHVLTNRREKAARATASRREQLAEFYGPLLAMHKEIQARSELRVKLQQAVDTQYAQGLLEAGPGNTEQASDAKLPGILTNIEDEKETFENVLMPRYRDMVNVFREKMWLAQPETRAYFKDLIEFVDVWDKILAKKLPHSIAPAVGHTEKNLHPFYRHLEDVHDRLRVKIS